MERSVHMHTDDFGAYEKYILDTTLLSVEDTVLAIIKKVANKATLLLESLEKQ